MRLDETKGNKNLVMEPFLYIYLDWFSQFLIEFNCGTLRFIRAFELIRTRTCGINMRQPFDYIYIFLTIRMPSGNLLYTLNEKRLYSYRL